MTYIHLTVEEREKIQKLLWQKKSLRYILHKELVGLFHQYQGR
jgi:IS30 family transposase